MFGNSSKAPYLFLTLFISLLYFTGIADRAFVSRGEGREALVAQSILEEHRWILPLGYGETVPSKPPLLHWLIAVASLSTGEVSEFSSRLPSALLAIFFIIAYFTYLKRIHSEQLALSAVLILATSFEWLRAATSVRVDMVFSVFLAGGLLFLYASSRSRPALLPAVVCFSLAVLAKGPVALVLPSIIYAAFLFLVRKQSFPMIILRNMLVFLPCLFLAGLWYFAAYNVGGSAFLDKVWDENVGRFLGTMHDTSHKHSFFYLWGSLVPGMGLWLLLLIAAVFSVRRKKGSLIINIRSAGDFDKYCWLAILSFLIFFSIPASKRGVYLLPIYPFLAFQSARALHYLLGQSDSVARYFSVILTAASFAIGLLLLLIASLPIDLIPGLVSSFSQEAAVASFLLQREVGSTGLFYVCLLIVLAGSIYLGRLGPGGNYIRKLAFQFILLVAALQYLVIRPLANGMSSQDFAGQLNETVAKDVQVYSFMNEFYGLSYYARRDIERLTGDELPERGVIVLYEDNIDRLRLLTGDRDISVLTRSDHGVERLLRRVIAVKFERGENNRPLS